MIPTLDYSDIIKYFEKTVLMLFVKIVTMMV